MAKKWTRQAAEKYINKVEASKGVKGLTYWSARDYLKNHKVMGSFM